MRAISEPGRDADSVAAAFLHPLKRLGKARNDLIGEQRHRSLAGARIEHLPIRKAPFVFDQHSILRLDRRSGTYLDSLDLHCALTDRMRPPPGERDARRNDENKANP